MCVEDTISQPSTSQLYIKKGDQSYTIFLLCTIFQNKNLSKFCQSFIRKRVHQNFLFKIMQDQDNCPLLPWMLDFHSTENGQVLNTQLSAAFAKTTLEHLSTLNIKSKVSNFRATQLCCKIPPHITCQTIEELLSLDVSAMLITAPIEFDTKARELLSKIRTIVERYNKKIGRIYPLAVGVQIKGPEIRTGLLKDTTKKEIQLHKGAITHLTTDPMYEEFVDEKMIYIDYEKFANIVQAGDRILLGNGSVTLSALEAAESAVKCIVEKAGHLISRASVTLLNAPIDLQLINDNDKQMLEFGVEEKVDFVFIQGVTNRECVWQVKKSLGNNTDHILLIAIIDNLNGIENAGEIIRASDGVCIDGNKLMMELGKEKVFLAQKSLIAQCNVNGKPVYCTTHFTDVNEITKPEICDIANVILEGADGLLIQPNALKKFIIKTINDVCKEAEPAIYQRQLFEELVNAFTLPMEPIYALAITTVETSLKCNAGAIINLTCSGRTAKILSRFRPRCPIIAVTRCPRVARQLKFYRNVHSLVFLRTFDGDFKKDVQARLNMGMIYGRHSGFLRNGDTVVTLTASSPETGLNDSLKVVYVSDFDAAHPVKRLK